MEMSSQSGIIGAHDLVTQQNKYPANEQILNL